VTVVRSFLLPPPSGASYLLANRAATAQMLPEPFGREQWQPSTVLRFLQRLGAEGGRRLTPEERAVEAVLQGAAYEARTRRRLPAGPVDARKAADREPKRRVLVPARAKGPRTGRGGFA